MAVLFSKGQVDHQRSTYQERFEEGELVPEQVMKIEFPGMLYQTDQLL